MRFRTYLNESAFDFRGKSPAEIEQHYLQTHNGDPRQAYRFLSMARDARRREPEVEKAIYNAQVALHARIQGGDKTPNKWEHFENELKNHDWYHEMSDDPRRSRKGRENHARLQGMYKDLAKEDKERAMKLVKKHVPEDKRKNTNESFNF